MGFFSKLYKFTLAFAACATAMYFTVSAADISAGTVNVGSSLNVRNDASSSSKIIGSLKNNDKVIIADEKDGWYYISNSDLRGYVSSDYVAASEKMDYDFGNGAITGSVVNLRQSANTDSAVLCKLRSGAGIAVNGVENGWFKVKYGDKSGFVYGDYVELSNKTTAVISNDVTSGNAADLINYAKSFLGVKYVSGGSSPSGFDCSGFTKYVFKHFGISLSRTSSGQAGNCTAVSKSALQPGDLVFFSRQSSSKIGHVGIYIGDGKFIHSSSPGDVVKIDSMSNSYYAKHYISAGRTSL